MHQNAQDIDGQTSPYINQKYFKWSSISEDISNASLLAETIRILLPYYYSIISEIILNKPWMNLKVCCLESWLMKKWRQKYMLELPLLLLYDVCWMNLNVLNLFFFFFFFSFFLVKDAHALMFLGLFNFRSQTPNYIIPFW